MVTTVAESIAPDRVVSFDIRPGTLERFIETLAEGGPLIKCHEGSVTLVSPGYTHETSGHRLVSLILAVYAVLRIPHTALGSTYYSLPAGSKDSGYEPDQAYHIQSYGTASRRQVPDLAIEIVVSHSERKALACGELLGIPEMWVLDIPKHRLTFYHLDRRGDGVTAYHPQPASLAFPFLTSAEVLERLDDPEQDGTAFHENCRDWTAEVLAPRRRG